MPSVTLPCNLEAERVVLGSMLLDRVAAELGLASLKVEDFSSTDPRNGMIFKAMSELASQGSPIDPQTVIHMLINLKMDKAAGGNAYIYELITGIITERGICRAPYDSAFRALGFGEEGT